MEMRNMRTITWKFLPVAVLTVLTLCSSSFYARAADYGLQPGAKAPAFTLKDQDGKAQTLESLSGPNGLLILFNRSADWCPFCKSQLIDVEAARHNFEAKGVHVASITYDSPDVLRAFAARRNIHFALLSDPDSAVIDAFGVRNHEAEAVGSKSGIAIPNYFLISPDGVICRRFAETALLDRITANYLYEALFGAGTAQPTLTSTVPKTPHLSVSLTQSDVAAAPGARVQLTVQLAPEQGSHLYAPGAEKFGYHPIKLTLDSSPLYQTRPAGYGQATTIRFADLKETVPVFANATVISQDIWAVRSPQTNAEFNEHPDLVINGSLEYQVCTNTTCYPPATQPVSWKLHVTPGDLDMIRVAEGLRKQ
jgi:peroxiredoxin